MSRVTQSDFFYGAVLSVLFNNKMCPVLVEGGDDRRIYDVITNKDSYTLFMKYRSRPATLNDDYQSWQFAFSDSDIREIGARLGPILRVVLIGGMEKVNASEIVVLDEKDIWACLFDLGKTSLTIGRKKHEKYFRASVGGGRDSAHLVKANRIAVGQI